jgi:hypothetical protein
MGSISECLGKKTKVTKRAAQANLKGRYGCGKDRWITKLLLRKEEAGGILLDNGYSILSTSS